MKGKQRNRKFFAILLIGIAILLMFLSVSHATIEDNNGGNVTAEWENIEVKEADGDTVYTVPGLWEPEKTRILFSTINLGSFELKAGQTYTVSAVLKVSIWFTTDDPREVSVSATVGWSGDASGSKTLTIHKTSGAQRSEVAQFTISLAKQFTTPVSGGSGGVSFNVNVEVTFQFPTGPQKKSVSASGTITYTAKLAYSYDGSLSATIENPDISTSQIYFGGGSYPIMYSIIPLERIYGSITVDFLTINIPLMLAAILMLIFGIMIATKGR